MPIRSHVASSDAGVVAPDALPKVVVVTSDECGFLLDQIYFDDGSSSISAAQMPVIESTATMLTCLQRGERVHWEIQGHADATEPHPFELSDARAKAVRDELAKRGVSPDSMTMQGYADAQPIDRGPTSSAHARNRRVELLILSRSPRP